MVRKRRKKKKEYPKQIILISDYHKKKYISNLKTIVMRSSWEEDFFKFLMNRKDVLEVGSENVVIPYRQPDGSPHRYFMDFAFTVRQKDGTIKRFLVEVKPFVQVRPPKKQKSGRNIEGKYKKACNKYLINIAKWGSAINWCYQYDLTFLFLTDNPKKKNAYKIWDWKESKLALPLNDMHIRAPIGK